MKVRMVSALLWMLAPVFAYAGGAVDQLHAFLGGTKTLRGEFSQTVVAKNGRKPQQSSGFFAIARPGKLRWEIKRPFPQLIVGDGDRVWIYDQELAQVTVKKVGQALGSTPAALLAGNNDLERNFALKEGGRSEGLDWVEAIPKNADSGFEKVRLGFSGGELRGMELYDSFGQTTYLRIVRLERNPQLSPGQFKFEPPKGADVVGE